MKLKIIFIILIMVSTVSLFLNAILAISWRRQYAENLRIRFDPAESRVFDNEDAKVERDHGPLVVFVGDSRIDGWDPLARSQTWKSLNRGIGGQTSAQVLLRLEQDVIALHPSCVVVQVGINDLKTIGVCRELEDEIVKSCVENMKSIALRLRSSEIKVIILTVISPGVPGPLRTSVWSNKIYTAVMHVNEELRMFEEQGIAVLDCNTFLCKGLQIKPEYADGTLHLSSQAYAELNKRLEPLIDEIIQSKK